MAEPQGAGAAAAPAAHRQHGGGHVFVAAANGDKAIKTLSRNFKSLCQNSNFLTYLGKLIEYKIFFFFF